MCDTITRENQQGASPSKPVPKPRGSRKSTALSSDDENNSLPESFTVNDNNDDSINPESETTALNEKIDTLKEEIETLKTKIEELTEENEDLADRADKTIPVQSSTEEVDDLKESVDALMREKTELNDKNNYNESELQKLREELKLERQNTFTRYADISILFLIKRYY